MSVPVLIGFAGVLVAAVATGMLGGRCVRQPRIDFIAWTAATFGLTIALAAQSIGFASGFSSFTFRAVQLFALLLVPLWLAWGLVELVAQSGAGRFAFRLAAGALTAVGAIILATDPLTAQPFGKSWPAAGLHYQSPSHYALDVVQLVAVITALATIGLVAVRGRNDPRWLAVLTGAAPVGVAVLVTVALRFSLPARSAYPLLAMLAAGLVWFGVARLQDQPGRGARENRGARADLSARAGGGARADRGARADQAERANWAGRAGDGYERLDRNEANGHGRRRDPWPAGGPEGPGWAGRPESPGWAGGPEGPGWDDVPGDPAESGRRYDDWPAAPDPDGRPLAAPEAPLAAPPGALGAPGAAAGLAAENEFGQYGKLAEAAAGRPSRPYGRIVIFTLLEDRVADFDRLAEQTAEEVRTAEPDTLVYVIHLVPNAPMQRIFYEIYRDRDAFDRYENQPYMQRFVAERRSCVLATNVIELRLKYAKVAPLPQLQSADPGPQAGPPVAGPARPPAALGSLAPLPPGPSAAWTPGQVQTLEPLPPGPDRRRPPAAGQRYDGA
jgi:quinol monooxygenase YgiN